MVSTETETILTKFPCPICGQYSIPYLVTKDGISMCECKDHGLYQTSNKVSKNFRIFCSRIASKPNRSQSYYTSLEKKVRKILEECGYHQGKDFFHNILIENGRRKYYVDFILPVENLVIEANGSVWHNLWNRKNSDETKIKYLESLGYRVVVVDEKNYSDLVGQLRYGVL
jgi:hypothetical protein